MMMDTIMQRITLQMCDTTHVHPPAYTVVHPTTQVDAALAHHRSEQPPANNAHPYRHLHDDDDDDDDEEDDDEEEEDERDGVFSVYDEEEEAWVDPTGGVLTRLTRLAVVNQFDEIASMLPTLNKDVLNLTGTAT